jgi:hypothetical protein
VFPLERPNDFGKLTDDNIMYVPIMLNFADITLCGA